MWACRGLTAPRGQLTSPPGPCVQHARLSGSGGLWPRDEPRRRAGLLTRSEDPDKCKLTGEQGRARSCRQVCLARTGSQTLRPALPARRAGQSGEGQRRSHGGARGARRLPLTVLKELRAVLFLRLRAIAEDAAIGIGRTNILVLMSPVLTENPQTACGPMTYNFISNPAPAATRRMQDHDRLAV